MAVNESRNDTASAKIDDFSQCALQVATRGADAEDAAATDQKMADPDIFGREDTSVGQKL